MANEGEAERDNTRTRMAGRKLESAIFALASNRECRVGGAVGHEADCVDALQSHAETCPNTRVLCVRKARPCACVSGSATKRVGAMTSANELSESHTH
eukprot:6147223-Pleurochrysis_carterae.AAC.1